MSNRKIYDDAIHKVLQDLAKLNKPMALLVGAHAATQHLPSFRATEDVDLLVSVQGSNLTHIKGYLAGVPGYADANGVLIVQVGAEEVVVDLISPAAFDHPPCPTAVRTVPVGAETTISNIVATVLDLILLKIDTMVTNDISRSLQKRTNDDIMDLELFIEAAKSRSDIFDEDQWRWVYYDIGCKSSKSRNWTNFF